MMSLWHVSSLNVRSTRITSFLSYVLAIQALIVVASVKIFIEKKNVEIEKNIYMYKKKKGRNKMRYSEERKRKKGKMFLLTLLFVLRIRTHTYTFILSLFVAHFFLFSF